MPEKVHISSFTRSAVTDIKQYIERNPFTYKTCNELLEKVDPSKRGPAETAFKQLTGYGLKEFLVYVRLEQSKQYLKQGWSVKRVAAKTLYRSQSAYCTAFKRYFNITPTGWLKITQ